MAKRKSPLSTLVETVVTIAIAVGVAILIQAFVVKPYRIPSSSMEPTLNINQRVLVNRLVSKPSLGDIVVFHPPQGADPTVPVCGSPSEGNGHPQACDVHTQTESTQTYIKRVVGLPGDTLVDPQRTRLSGRQAREGLLYPAVRRTTVPAISRRRSRFRPASTS